MTEREFRTVRLVPGGPMMVEGPVCIETADGTVVRSDRFMVAICACHRSKTYPLCDTSHRRRARKNTKSTAAEQDASPSDRPTSNPANPASAQRM